MDPVRGYQIGIQAEQDACKFLQMKGFLLLEQNYNWYGGEIDLIMQDQEDIVFIEVRQRRSIQYGNALESINRNKMTKLLKTATHFLQSRSWLYKKNSRFDVIAIHPVAGKMQIEWIKNAFTIDKYW